MPLNPVEAIRCSHALGGLSGFVCLLVLYTIVLDCHAWHHTSASSKKLKPPAKRNPILQLTAQQKWNAALIWNHHWQKRKNYCQIYP